MKWQVAVTETAKKMLLKLSKGEQRSAIKRMQKLVIEPQQQGRPLSGDLAGYRRIRTGRLRIIFRVDQKKATVYIIAVGLRRAGDKADIYQITKKVTK